MLDDFIIEDFRSFNYLYLGPFGEVNLFVGRNNVGKTTALEAIRLYFSDDWQKMVDLLISRDEYLFRNRRKKASSGYDVAPLSFESLFNGRPPLETHPAFVLGPTIGPALTVRFTWLRRVEEEESATIRYVPEFVDNDLESDVLPGFIFEGKTKLLVPLDRMERVVRRRVTTPTQQNVVYLPSSGMPPDQLGRIWDSVALTEDEDVVVDTLQAIVPTLEKLVLVQSPNARSERLLMAKLAEFAEPVPFKSLGDGVLHLLGLVLALLSARNGVLLADEVENGLHFSVQAKFWEIMLRQARAWKVQVFSTTHSWDCVRGLMEADLLSEQDSELFASAALFRLEKIGDGFRSIAFTSDELMIANREDIEVR